ncbi:ABC transporter substrate-binding protein [Mycobacterium sp. CVI_P3]|uniref:ABC transporter substrate-binding protein n=1 Tax=Mycobacterium pinniadriaticum TaxID=2994102 RepID=A0ABT3SQC3_9MYCO|nr:ABC transporter substrate-binding protein [Mycobacterium pinniadriaticum]MCX2934624.1 ABC transporter substrate-binding protein [Mycobacterium pinniadriaticum]MCX2941047.1 ABC transporter substrate-binding protein [Mycobacterium pinniadriaticum]
MAVGRRRAAAVAVAAVVGMIVSGVLTSCSGSPADQINYAVDGVLITYNTNTVTGAASAGPQAFARVLTGFNFHGPDGQVLADHDFGSVSVVGRDPLVLDYQISDKAVYSDGKPVTCDDMVLAWAAQSGRFPAFDAASRAGYLDIDRIDCQPGQKKARVTYLPGRAITDYLQLFTATSLMPSHVLGDVLGLDVTRAIESGDLAAIDRIATAWNTVWDLKPGVDLKRFPSSGPYKIDSVLPEGAVVLTANDRWWGAKPITKRITVWPRGVDVQDRVNNGTFQVVDVATGSSGTVTTPDDYDRQELPSGGIEQLIFAPVGPLAATPARRAVALCTPRDLIALNAETPISNARLNPATDDAFSGIEGVAIPGQFGPANPDAARDALGGQPLTVRIGYQAPNPRLAATVGAITKSCAAAGITIVDTTSDSTGPQTLRDGQIDVLVASTGGASGSGSTGSSALDAYTLFSGDGNNLPRYFNPQIDGIISALAVTADPKEQARLLGDSSPILWGDMPTLPLYRQQRTVMASKKMYAVEGNPTKWGAGWNMDRWVFEK